MKSSLNISALILDELLLTVEVIGIEKTIKTLQAAKQNNLLSQDFFVDFILDTVADVMKITKERIVSGNDRKTDERKMAIALSVYFIRNECNYSYSELKLIFNKDESNLSRYYSMVENRPEKSKTDFDKKIEEYYKKINLLIIQKKLKNG
jgi:hypothetical protein